MNNLVLKEDEEKIIIKDIFRLYWVGKFNFYFYSRFRDIIVKFVSYRDWVCIYGNKRNLKVYNNNLIKKIDFIYINEVFIWIRLEFFCKIREFVKLWKINSFWIYDGCIFCKLNGVSGKKVIIFLVEDFECFYEDDDDEYEDNI